MQLRMRHDTWDKHQHNERQKPARNQHGREGKLETQAPVEERGNDDADTLKNENCCVLLRWVKNNTAWDLGCRKTRSQERECAGHINKDQTNTTFSVHGKCTAKGRKSNIQKEKATASVAENSRITPIYEDNFWTGLWPWAEEAV
jgi:hypothetical protein